jgi:hypothetical protein
MILSPRAKDLHPSKRPEPFSLSRDNAKTGG